MKPIYEYMMQASNFHSTKLNEYLSTKIKYHKSEFPKNFSHIEEFLIKNDFTEINLTCDSFETYVGELDTMNIDYPFYLWAKYKNGLILNIVLMFSNGGKFTQDNPLFTIDADDCCAEMYYIDKPLGKQLEINATAWKDVKKEFIPKILNNFDWV